VLAWHRFYEPRLLYHACNVRADPENRVSETGSRVWKQPATVATLNAQAENTLAATLGMVVTELGDDFIRASMAVDARTVQPYGLLHGGASLALAETLGSVAANLCLASATQMAVGLEINANHLRAVRSGRVIGTARALHVGRQTQVWEIRIEDERDHLVCVSRLTLAVVEREH